MAKEPEAGSPSWNSVTFQGNRVPCIHPFDSFSAESAERTIQGNKNWCRYLTNPNRYTLWHHLGEIQQNYHIHLRSYKHCLIPPTKKKHFHHPAAFQKRQGSSQHFSLQRFCQLPQFCHAASTWRGSPVEGKNPDPVGEGTFQSDLPMKKNTSENWWFLLTPFQNKAAFCQLNWKVQGESCFYVFFSKHHVVLRDPVFLKANQIKQDQPATDWEWWFGELWGWLKPKYLEVRKYKGLSNRCKDRRVNYKAKTYFCEGNRETGREKYPITLQPAKYSEGNVLQ